MGSSSGEGPGLRRVLSLWVVIFYGLGVIIGAGIYVAIGGVISRAGDTAPFSFLIAGIAAGLTGLCYAELASRFPEAAGSAAYVQRAFGSVRLAQVTGVAVTIAVGVAAASIARGAVHYLMFVVPASEVLLLFLVITGFTVIAMIGVRESVGLAALIGIVEIGGLIIATVAGFRASPSVDFWGMIPDGLESWSGSLAGAFVAFFAFLGFETLANLAEEVMDAPRTLPRGILAALAISLVLYVTVAVAAVSSDKSGGLPLVALFEGDRVAVFAVIGFLAVANGVLVEIIMLARLFYGMARAGQLPAQLARVSTRTRTPVTATLAAGLIVLAAALLVPFERLLVVANTLTLCVFALVDVALWRLKTSRASPPSAFEVSSWVPITGVVLTFLLIFAELLNG